MTRESIIAIGIAIMCLSIFIFNAIKTKDEYLWSEAIGIMLIIDLPIGGLLFWLFSLLSPVIACIWGVLSPLVIYKVGDFIDSRKTITETNANREEQRAGSVVTPRVQTEAIVLPTEEKDNPVDDVSLLSVTSPAKSGVDTEDKQVKQTLMFCLRCGKKITYSICKECKYDNTSSILLLNRVDPCQLQVPNK